MGRLFRSDDAGPREPVYDQTNCYDHTCQLLTDELLAHALSDEDSDISPLAANIIRTLQYKLSRRATQLCIGYYVVDCVSHQILAGPFRTKHESQVELATRELERPSDRCVVLFSHRSDITWG